MFILHYLPFRFSHLTINFPYNIITTFRFYRDLSYYFLNRNDPIVLKPTTLISFLSIDLSQMMTNSILAICKKEWLGEYILPYFFMHTTICLYSPFFELTQPPPPPHHFPSHPPLLSSSPYPKLQGLAPRVRAP